MPPEMIAGRYRVVREVGRGGMGSVWLCRDERLGREVAVKQVGGLPGESSMHLARALREARHSAALNHPNVVAIYDALEEGDHVWLVMEYVPSRTLAEIIRADGPMAPGRAAWVGAQVADGLAAAHALGTVHRDVKPSNILVRDDDRALIADFGIARTVGQEQLTRSGMVTGTPAYFAPELARGSEPSPASDAWALGVSLYAAVQGEPAYAESANAIAMLNTIANQPPPTPSRAGPLAEPIAGMMEPDPASRWTMDQVATALHGIAGSGTEPDDEVEEAPTALLPALPVATAEPANEPRVDTVPVAAPPGARRGAPLVLAAVLLLAVVALGGWWLTRDPDEETATDPSGGSTSTESTETPSDPDPSPSGETGSGDGTDPSPDQTEEPAPSATPSEAEQPPAAGADSAVRLVTDYYNQLPEDTDASWSMLTPALQEQIGRESFDGFWATVDDVSVEDVEEAGDSQLTVTLTYSTGGGTERETRLLEVEQDGDGFLISADRGAV